MTLVERYVRAVRDFLPRAHKDDITNELSDSIQSRFEDEAEARGRPLTEDEQVAILRSLGHPMAVAARYRGDDRSVRFGGQLIGPELFPTYLMVLRINLSDMKKLNRALEAKQKRAKSPKAKSPCEKRAKKPKQIG